MSETEKLFRKYKNSLISKLGRDALYSDVLEDVAKTFFGTRFKGVFSQDEKFEKKTGYYIINTDTKKGKGIHWIALYLTSKTAYIYDSFGRSPNKLIPHLVKHLADRKIVSSDKDQEQKGLSQVCGHLSISWLRIVKEKGIKKAIKI